MGRRIHDVQGPNHDIWVNTLQVGETVYTEAGLNKIITATAVLDFGLIAAASTAELTVTVAGATAGSAVAIGTSAAWEAGLIAMGYCIAANTVVIRVANITAAGIDPASKTIRATVILP